jgi:hypothetical protein
MNAAKPVVISHEAAWDCRGDFSRLLKLQVMLTAKTACRTAIFRQYVPDFLDKTSVCVSIIFYSGERPLEFRSI